MVLSATWVMRLPRGVREQPGWVFIGLLVALAGLGFVTGLARSSVTEAIGPTGLRIWGAVLLLSGIGVTVATFSSRPALEKFALRVLALCMIMYVGWLLVVLDWKRAILSVILALALAGLAEIRVAVLKSLYRLADRWEQE